MTIDIILMSMLETQEILEEVMEASLAFKSLFLIKDHLRNQYRKAILKVNMKFVLTSLRSQRVLLKYTINSRNQSSRNTISYK